MAFRRVCLPLAVALVLLSAGLWPPGVGLARAAGGSAGSGSMASARPGEGRRVVLLAVEGFSLDDLTPSLRNTWQLARLGGLGLMNTSTGGSRNPADGYATIAFGAQVRVGQAAGSQLFDVGELAEGRPAGQVYQARTGLPAPAARGGVALNLARLLESLPTSGGKDGLGEVLRAAGYRTAVIGNSDRGEEKHREAALLALNGQGLVDLAAMNPALVLRPAPPASILGEETDYEAVWRYYRLFAREARLVVVNLGDLARWELARQEATPERAGQERHRLLQGLDSFIGRVMLDSQDAGSLLVLLAPAPNQADLRESRLLVPLIVSRPEQAGGSTLISPTTRRAGIVANTDLAPTILGFLGLAAPSGLTGRGIETIDAGYSPEDLKNLANQAAFTYRWRQPILQGYILAQIIAMIASLAALLGGLAWRRYLYPLLLLLVAVPLALLLLPGIAGYQAGPAGYIAAFLGLAALLALAGDRLAGRGLAGFGGVSLVTALALLLDLANGAELMKHSVLGYDPQAGARYYGIGNEYMGVLIGSAVSGATILAVRLQAATAGQALAGRRRTATFLPILAFLALAVYFLAAPFLGANVGGTIAAIFAFSTLGLGLSGRQRPAWRWALPVALTLITLGLVFSVDAQQPVAVQTHVGRVATLAHEQGAGALAEVATRKLAMNLKLIRYTIWSRVLLVIIGGLLVLLYRPVGLLSRTVRDFPALQALLPAIATGSVVALLVNDSGIVAAATMLIYGVAPLTWALLLAGDTGEKTIDKGGVGD